MKADVQREDEKLDDVAKPPQNEEDEKPPFSNYWRIVSFGTRIEHVIICIATVTAAGSGVALPLMNIIFGNLVNDFNTYGGPETESLEDQFRASTSRNALFFVYLFIGKFVLTYIGMFCFRAAGLRISAALRLAYLKALFSQPIRKLDQVSSGTVASTITTSANTIQASIGDRLSGLFQSLALVIAAYGVAFKYSWALTLAVSSGILFVLVCLTTTTPFTIKAIHRVTKADEKHATVVSEALSSIRTVFALGAEPKMLRRHKHWVDVSHKHSMRVANWVATQLSPFYFATYASYGLAFWFGLKLYREGNIDGVNNVIIVFFSVLLVTTVLGQIAQPIVAINQAISASTSFFDIIDSDQVRTEGLKDPEVSSHDDIELRDVTFAYPTRSTVTVLKQFSATIQKGKTTALVGPSGSGKSTIVALLERWYSLNDISAEPGITEAAEENAAKEKGLRSDIEELDTHHQHTIGGSITIGGVNIDELDLKWWRSQIGLVQQEPFLFNDTIENNVAYGLIGTPWEDAEPAKKLQLVKEACVEAFADGFICKLPDGYSSRVGEGGIKLSGGQRQRIAIARSIVRKPAILILDEATSAIDVQGEQIVQAALDRASRNRTTIMIAHRLSTVKKADHIIVLRGGQKIEEGTHEDLLSDEDGLYYSLVKAQKIEEQEDGPEDTLGSDSLAAIKPQLTRTSTRHSLAGAAIDDPEATMNENGIPPSTYKRKGIFGTVGLFLYEQSSRWILFIVLVLAAMGSGAASAIQSWLFAQLVQTFQYVGQRLIDAANFWSLMFFVLALGATICYGTLAISSGVVSTHIGTRCRREYFSDTLRMPIAYFDREENASGSVMQRVSSDPRQIQDLLGINSAFPLISLFTVIGCVILSFYFGWKLTLVTFFAVMPIIMGASFLRMRYEIQFEANNSKVFATSSQFATEASGAFRTVSSLGMEDVVIKKYDHLLAEQIRISTRKASYAMLVYALTDSIELCGMALTFWYGGQLLASGEYSPFQFFVIYSAIVQGSQAAGMYLSIAPNLANATAAGNRILEMREQAKKNSDFQQKDKEHRSPGLGAAISFKDVTFRYPGIETPLFTNLNITIEPGQFVAFVGPSGCGKTTVISMLERFYDPDAGTITVDGKDISAQDSRTYRQNLALVSQEPRLFSGTVRENLLLGLYDENDNINAKPSTSDAAASAQKSEKEEEQSNSITEACTAAEIHTFITSLPESYGTELGQNTQTALSGGQKQRLCLARALLRRPNLLLLDEATSSLDSQSEKLVQGAIERLASGETRSMTVIAVAHRLATIQKADVIYVFGERDTERRGKGVGSSRIVEIGSHNELMAKKGVYWSMCRAQALDR